MSTELVIDVSPSEIAIALQEDKQLVELNKEKRDIKFAVGDIYLGKVKRIMPGLNAAFVDVGYNKDAFLHYLDLSPQFRSLDKFLRSALGRKGKTPPLSKMKLESDIDKDGKIAQVLKGGQLVVVQIAKEPISTKGPRLSSEISIAGRNLVLLPFSDKVSVSQKISSPDEKKRLKSLVQSIKPKNYGVIVRTVAEGKKVATLDVELRGLVKKWESAFERLSPNGAPKQVIGELDRTSAILRDILDVSFNNIYVNEDTVYRELRDYISTIAPEKEKIVRLYDGGNPIFDHYGVEKQIKSLFGKTVSFKNGAYLIIEHTEALHVIDVNSGNRSKLGEDQESNALEVNLAAADEIARQLRLRDMGGIIVVDFIDMHLSENKQKVFEKMKAAMSADRTKHSILPLTKFGLLQITRQRVRPELNIKTIEKCPTCKGTSEIEYKTKVQEGSGFKEISVKTECPVCSGTGETESSVLFVDQIEKQLQFLISRDKYKKLVLKVHPYVASYINKGFFSLRRKWRYRFNCKIKVMPVMSYHFLEYQIFNHLGELIEDL